MFSIWRNERQQRETLVHCSSSGPDSLPGMPTSGNLPHCKGGYLSGVWEQLQKRNAGAAGSDGVSTATALFFRNAKSVSSAPSSEGAVDPRQLYIGPSSIQGVRLLECHLH